MTTNTKQLEDKFNRSLPKVRQATDIGQTAPTKFSRARYLKAAQELQKVVDENNSLESSKL